MTPRDEWLLAIRLRQLGDVLAALATLQALKAHRPERRIAYVVEAPYADLLRGLDFIDALPSPPRGGASAWRAYLASLRRLHPTAAIDFHGSARSALMAWISGAPTRVGFDVRGRRAAYTHVVPRGEFRDGVRVPHTPIEWGMRLAQHVGVGTAEGLPPRLAVSDAARARAREALSGQGISRGELDARALVGVNPGRPAPVKSWDPARFAQLARRLAGSGRRALVFWGPGEEETARAIVRDAGTAAVLAPATPLAGMPALLDACGALVTIDSGLKHLAVCVRVPTVTVFGATDPREWHMGGGADAVLWRGLSCSPCRRTACPFGAPCMDVSVDAVWSATERVLGAVAREARA
ncbi:MAG TPA: glycosyltransferase family 9 protein [Candidatus Krumholzibacteria bacterium]|nr:glycosyltransferase family 9 protein [Candidatus Krumholzibacteria bacterium]